MRFQIAVLALDLGVIAFFIATPLIRNTPSFLWMDYAIAGVLALDLLARWLASTDMAYRLRCPTL